MSSAGQKMIFLKSSDGETLEVEEAVAFKSQTIKQMIENKHMIEDKCIPLRNVTSTILAKVIEYCKRHADAATKANADGTLKLADNVVDEDLKAFDAEFVNVDQSTLFGLVDAACYLKIKSLVDLTCQTVADMIKGKTPEEIRKDFSILKDYLILAEEEEVRRENEMEEMRRENAVMPS